MSKRFTVARLEAWFRRLWAHWLGHVCWLTAAAALAWQLPHVLAALTLGVLVGLRAGKVWRDRLREERDAARRDVDRWNRADDHYALDEVGSVAPERRNADLYEQTGTETLPPAAEVRL